MHLLLAIALATSTPVATIICYHEVDPPTENHATLPRRSATADESTEMQRLFVYPKIVGRAAARFGYDAAVATERGSITRDTSPMRLERHLVHNDTTLEEFKTFL